MVPIGDSMVTINQDGLVPVAVVHPRVMQAHEKVRDFQQRVRSSVGTQADRDALYRQLEGWLHDLKMLTLIAFRYREQHDFFNRTFNQFDESDDCPAGATPEQQFQHANNLVMTGMRLELETFHIYTSTLMDRVARIYPTYFGEKNAVVANTDESFWKQAKHRPDITYLTPELKADAKWLQDKVDWFRNRVLIHPEGYEREGFHMRGLKSKATENVRTFARARKEVNGEVKEVDHESQTLEAVVERLCQYVERVIDILDKNAAASVLLDSTRPRPERI
jgi:hypothetical protein